MYWLSIKSWRTRIVVTCESGTILRLYGLSLSRKNPTRPIVPFPVELITISPDSINSSSGYFFNVLKSSFLASSKLMRPGLVLHFCAKTNTSPVILYLGDLPRFMVLLTISPNLAHIQFSGISNVFSSSVISGRGFSFLIFFSLMSFSFSACIYFRRSRALPSSARWSVSLPWTARSSSLAFIVCCSSRYSS